MELGAAAAASEEVDSEEAASDDVLSDDVPADPDATTVTPSPAADVVEAARRPSRVSVAESTLTLLEDVEAAACAPGGNSPPATTVTADAMVCIVLADAAMGPSWNAGGGGAFMGKDPAGHEHMQRQPPFAAACSAAAALAVPPEPAMTVAAAPAFEVVDAAIRASLVSVPVLAEPVEDDEEEDAAAASGEPVPAPATTVTALAFAVAWAWEVDELELELELSELEFSELPEPPDPACTVTVPPAATAPLTELVDEPLVELELLLPPALPA